MGTAPTITGPDVWRGEDIQQDSSWLVMMTPEMVQELDEGLAEAERRGLSIPFPASDFPFERCQQLVDRVTELLHEGPGLALIRGLPRDRYSDEQCELIYWAFAIHLGTPVSQNSRGHLIGHVRNEGLTMADPNVRAYQTNAKLDFHSDQLPVDVLGLFCLRTARSGGASKIVSATAVNNVIKEERPDLLEVLYEPFNIDWRGEEPNGEAPWYQLPMLSESGGKVTSRFTSLAYFKSVDRYGAHLAQTPEQMEALDFAQQVANRPVWRSPWISRRVTCSSCTTTSSFTRGTASKIMKTWLSGATSFGCGWPHPPNCVALSPRS